jgi:hypothetical protein
MALDATVGGSSSDSYVTVNEADTFFSSHYQTAKTSTWSVLSSAQKEAVLRRATQILDSLRILDTEYGAGALPTSLVAYEGYELTIHRQLVNQRLQFPRNIDIGVNDIAFVPQNVKDAQCEQAVFLINFDDSSIATQMAGIKVETVAAGSVRVRNEYTGTSLGSSLAPMALELMREFLRPTRRMQRS